MSLLGIIPELPLLRRELTELSNRKRTYVIRFVGAIVVLTVVMLYYSVLVARLESSGYGFGSSNPNRYAGAGGLIFREIVPMLFVSIQMLMPALICGSITIEKERNTIGTLFVTRLSPMTIVLEKLGSRLVPMFTFLLLTFPVLAVVYSLGGVETTLLLGTLWLLFCECLLYASIGLLCSSWFATTVTAFIWSYVLTGLLAVFCVMFAEAGGIAFPTPFFLWLATFRGFNGAYGSGLLLLISGGFASTPGQLLFIGATTIPSLLVTTGFVMLARVFLVRRAFISSSSILLKVFKVVDGFFVRLNDRTTGGMVLMKDTNSLPLFDPVAWRERAKRSLGKARYLFRILVVMEGPTLFICVGAATVSARSDFTALRALLLLVWAIAGMILAMKGATIISAERVRETLDALLSTPLTSKEILTQKIAGMRRLMIVLAIPILSVHFTLLLLNVDVVRLFFSFSPGTSFMVMWYVASCVITTFAMMQILAWLSVLLGLRSQSQARSAMTAIGLITAWVLVTSFSFRPGSVMYETVLTSTGSETQLNSWARNEETPESLRQRTIAAAICCILRPDGGIHANEAVLIAVSSPYVEKDELYYAPSRSVASAISVSAIVLIWQLLMLMLIRMVTLRLAPRLLGRNDEASFGRSIEANPFALPARLGSEVIA